MAYGKLALVSLVHFIIMYLLGYAMVHAWEDVYSNINRVYMAGMMVLAMIPLMILTMRQMYPSTVINASILTGAVLLFAALFLFTRAQTFVNDRQFLKSMIPHHSGAITMCERAKITDAEILELCQKIKKSQQEEIDQMRSILHRLDEAS